MGTSSLLRMSTQSSRNRYSAGTEVSVAYMPSIVAQPIFRSMHVPLLLMWLCRRAAGGLIEWLTPPSSPRRAVAASDESNVADWDRRGPVDSPLVTAADGVEAEADAWAYIVTQNTPPHSSKLAVLPVSIDVSCFVDAIDSDEEPAPRFDSSDAAACCEQPAQERLTAARKRTVAVVSDRVAHQSPAPALDIDAPNNLRAGPAGQSAGVFATVGLHTCMLADRAMHCFSSCASD
jgi:hypothetical protein